MSKRYDKHSLDYKEKQLLFGVQTCSQVVIAAFELSRKKNIAKKEDKEFFQQIHDLFLSGILPTIKQRSKLWAIIYSSDWK